MFDEITTRRIKFIKKSIIYIIPIIFLIIAGSYFVISKFQKKNEFNVKLEFTNSIENEVKTFKINNLLYEYYKYIPENQYSKKLNIKNYYASFVDDFIALTGKKTSCLIRYSKIQMSLNQIYKLSCLDTSASKDKIKTAIAEVHEITTAKYINLYNDYIFKIIFTINQDEDPKKYFISTLTTYELNISQKDYFKDWLTSSFFIIISLAFLIYFGCHLLLNLRKN